MRGYCGERKAGKETAAGTGSGAYPAIARSLTFQNTGRGWWNSGDIAATIRTPEGGDSLLADIIVAGFRPNAGAKAGNIGYEVETAPTLNAEQTTAVYDARGNGDGNGKNVCALTGDHQSRVTDYTAIVMATGQVGVEITWDMVPTLNCNHEQPIISHGVTGIVRRLTPLECERLQGYPDGWTDIGAWTDNKGKLHKESSDAARYRVLGNSIALPPWAWVLKRLCGCYERPATMASLFDGIGGFPLIWKRLNRPGSCLWASEAVTKQHFGKEHAIP